MKIFTWAAVAVTALFALMNFGSVAEPDLDTPYRIVAIALGLAGVAAAIGLGTNQFWGKAVVIGVGVLNVVVAITGLFTDQHGAVVGIVIGGLGVVLGARAGGTVKVRTAERAAAER